MGSHMTHVANGSGRPLRVYYSTDRLNLEEIEIVYKTTAGHSKSIVSLSMSEEVKMKMKRDTRIRYIHVPINDFVKILNEGNIYVTVFLENSVDSDDCMMISQNFHIPDNRSFIVTANRTIKFQKYGANIWMDEQGNMHKK
ncbi:hypothetical protein SKAU_G00076040 [Synaphobranchus kaupii]|uniref:Uncharacterized protein n=1 Tax=Synaphobranchus kaupii TaxID=118154 RepID=A0A9Q1JA02_SYNKA|nr:hypothetical protein SKAU_G00076040 [Synaphobranchus kaupii]